MAYEISFDYLPSGVDMNSPSRWGKRHRRSTSIHGEIQKMVDKRADLPKEPMTAVEIHFTFYVPNLIQRDTENIRASMKPHIDGLVKAGVLAGDSIKHIYREVHDWELRRGQPGVRLIIAESSEQCEGFSSNAY